MRSVACGICGTDLEILRGDSARITGLTALGHEWVGTVVETTTGTDAQLGTLVVGLNRTTAPDGTVREIGFEEPGALAREFVVRDELLIAVPSGVDPMDAVLAEPTAVAAHTRRRTGAAPGRTAVIGAGPIGIITALLLRDEGVDVTVLTRSDNRRAEQARKLGFVQARTAVTSDDERWDCVVEASGDPRAIAFSIAHASEGGTVALAGSYPLGSVGDLELAMHKNLTIEGVNAAERVDWETGMRAIGRGVVTAERLSTTTCPLIQAPRTFERLLDGTQRPTKVVVTF